MDPRSSASEETIQPGWDISPSQEPRTHTERSQSTYQHVVGGWEKTKGPRENPNTVTLAHDLLYEHSDVLQMYLSGEIT